jgi:hypothetical protein
LLVIEIGSGEGQLICVGADSRVVVCVRQRRGDATRMTSVDKFGA